MDKEKRREDLLKEADEEKLKLLVKIVRAIVR